jgi:hypothetical protein
VKVPAGIDRKKMAKAAVELHNAKQHFFPASAPISMMIAFDAQSRQRNITSAEHIEALIDGMGAAIVRERRFFDAPKGKYAKDGYYFDDSCIFSLLAACVELNEDSGINAVVDVFV